MHMIQNWRPLAAGTLLAAFCATGAAATSLSITVTNNQAAGGFAITPLYTSLHDGTFDAFDVGGTASAGVEEIAEVGIPATVAQERLAVDPNSTGTVIASPSGPPPVQPGESVTVTLDVDTSSALYFSYLAMVLPSNDTFIGNDDSLAHQLFDATGAFLGDQVIEVTGAQIYDAGTELNQIFGAAFVAGEDAFAGDEEGGVIRKGQDLSFLAGTELATGDFLGDAAQLDFFTNPAAFSLLTIEISEIVAPVPLPASAPMLLAGLGGAAVWLRRRKKA